MERNVYEDWRWGQSDDATVMKRWLEHPTTPIVTSVGVPQTTGRTPYRERLRGFRVIFESAQEEVIDVETRVNEWFHPMVRGKIQNFRRKHPVNNVCET